ncbi:MAG: hypothetical protein SGBAC_012127, partial [Bacillariaceae sp.]
MTFSAYEKMEKEYFESLKENEADEAAELELQMERMKYLESLPRPNPTKARRKLLLLIFGLVALRCTVELVEPSFPLEQYQVAETVAIKSYGSKARQKLNKRSRCNWYAVGQWIWLRLAWSVTVRLITTDLIFDGDSYDFPGLQEFMTYSLALIGHGILLAKLPKPSGHRLSRLAEVNQTTVPVILSGLRVFCWGDQDPALRFLLTVAISFGFFELCGVCGCSIAFYSILADMEAEFSERRRKGDPNGTAALEAQSDGQTLQDIDGIDSSIPTKLHVEGGEWRQSWYVIGQWFWILLVWSFISYYLDYVSGLSQDGVYVMTWTIAMCGHGVLLAMRPRSRRERPSGISINRETLPLMLSACYFFWIEGTADDFMVSIATCVILSQALGTFWRFKVMMHFKEKETKNRSEDGAGETSVDRFSSSCNCCVIGQWIWLCIVWSVVNDAVKMYYFGEVVTYIVALIGHVAIFCMLLKTPASLVEVNQETLPVVLSGLRVFCLDDQDSSYWLPFDQDAAGNFLLIIAGVFLLSELYGFVGCSAARCRSLAGMEGEKYNNRQRIETKDAASLDTQNDGPASQDSNGLDSSNSTKLHEKNDQRQRSCYVIVQWTLLIFSVIIFNLLESITYDEAAPMTIAMCGVCGHGILLAVKTRYRRERLSRISLNRETLPMMLSACYLFSWGDPVKKSFFTNYFCVVIATCFILFQALAAAWRFIRMMHFATLKARESDNSGVDGVGASSACRISPDCSYCAIGQWIWLCLAWSFMRGVIADATNFAPVMLCIAAMVGHGILFYMLLKRPASLGEVNQETVPVILSGLRVFCLDDQDPAGRFLFIAAVVFVLSGLYGICGCSTTLYRDLIPENITWYGMVNEQNDEKHQRSEPEETMCPEAQDDDPTSQDDDGIDSSIPTKLHVEEGERWRSWYVVGQWIWILLVWFYIYNYLELKSDLSEDDAHVTTWTIA